MTSKRKRSFIDRFIEMLPEIHCFGYRYCGPNTNLTERLTCCEIGINGLDCACMDRDIAYAASIDPELRCNADKILLLKAFQRILAKDSRIGERSTALIVSWLIGTKLFLSKIEIYMREFWLIIKSIGKKNNVKKHIKTDVI